MQAGTTAPGLTSNKWLSCVKRSMALPLLPGTTMGAPVKTHNVMLEIEELTLADPRIVFLGSDLGSGMFERLKKEAPDRFFMEGVSEQHLIGMAAGLAKE